MLTSRGRLFAFVVLGFLFVAVLSRQTVLFVITICGAYGVLFTRLRKRRIGSAAVGSFYDMLEQDRRRAVEIVVDAKAEQQLPEDAEGGPDLK